jgi:hypothetical protein
MTESKLNQSFNDSLLAPGLNELAKDISEVSLDRIIEDPTFREVPLIGTLLNVYKVAVGIRGAFIVKKVAKFLFRLREISVEDRREFLNKLQKDEKYKGQVVEKLLLILDRLDEEDKAEVLGNLFKAAIEGKISVDEFLRLSVIVDKIYLKDLKALVIRAHADNDYADELEELFHKWYLYEMDKKNLSSLGVLREEIHEPDREYLKRNGISGNEKIKFKYSTSDLGTKLEQFAFDLQDILSKHLYSLNAF